MRVTYIAQIYIAETAFCTLTVNIELHSEILRLKVAVI